MKTTLLKSALAAVAALAVSQAPALEIYGGSTDFESIDITDAYFSGNTDGSAVAADATVATAASRPAHIEQVANYDSSSRTNVLAVEASTDAPLVRNLNSDGSAATASTIYADLLVKCGNVVATGTDASTLVTDATADQLLVYFKETEAGVTNLCVYAGGYVSNGSATSTADEYVLANAAGVTFAEDAWRRLVIVAKDLEADGSAVHGFNVYFGDYADNNLCKFQVGEYDEDMGEWYYSTDTGDFISLLPSASRMTALAFAGNGSIDDLVISDIAPDATTMTLTWDTSLASVSYTIDGVAGDALTVADGSATIAVASGAAVVLTGTSPYGTTFSANASGGTSTLALAATTSSLDWYFETTATEDGTAEKPFQIATYTDLLALQGAVANVTNCNGMAFQQTTDIALEAAWPGIGIPNGKDIVTAAAFDAGAFCGTYDGGNFTVSNFQMVGVDDNPANNNEGLDYCGFFNSTYGATIKNLKIEYKEGTLADDTTSSTKESGATFVGVAKASTLQNLTSLAPDGVETVSASKGFGGIVGYLMAGSTVADSTNNVNIVSLSSNKAGGIAMITQNGTGVALITNCVNNGTTAGNATQKGGIVGYVGVATEIADCTDTAGSNPSFLRHQTGTLTMSGENKAPASVVSYSKNATNIDGLMFATVDNEVATFVKATDLALDGTYKAMGPGASYAFTAAGTITIDQALVVPTVTLDASLVDYTLTSVTNGTEVAWTAAEPVEEEEALEPGQQSTNTYATAEAAATAAANVTIAASAAVEAALSAADLADYLENFEAQVVENEGVYSVKVGLKAAAEAALQTQADADAAAVVDGIGGTITLTATPGFYYGVAYGTDVQALDYKSAGVLATGSTVELADPLASADSASGFYRVYVSVTPVAAVAPAE
ncbi:MAG: hypothetical protein IJP66_07955 [Kiritimatiellae bacterium]|nr:hypothetical protein [Kiritimatiellia bacterium]